jgi:hypothetical protein
MNTPRTKENILKGSVFAILAIMALLQSFVQRGLFADGAYFLVYILDKHDFFVQNEPARLFMYWFTQFPTVLAVRLGVTSLTFLRYLFSTWLCMAPLLFWGLGLAKLRRDLLFWPFLALFTAIYFNANFFIIGEYNLSFAVSAFCLAMLLRDEPNTRSDRVLLMAAACLLVMTYASTMFMGALLAALSLRNFRRDASSNKTPYWLALTCLFLASVGVGVWSYLYPGLPGNKAEAMKTAVLFDDKQLWITAIVIGALVLQLIVPSRKRRNELLLSLLAIEAVNLLGLFRPTPQMAFSTRAFVGLFLFGGCLFLAWLKIDWLRNFKLRRLRNYALYYCMIPVFILFAECAFFDIKDSLAFNNFVNEFTAYSTPKTGFVPFLDFAYAVPSGELYGWCWTYPSMSLILRAKLSEGIILNPDSCAPHQLFDPYKNMPDFSRYYSG